MVSMTTPNYLNAIRCLASSFSTTELIDSSISTGKNCFNDDKLPEDLVSHVFVSENQGLDLASTSHNEEYLSSDHQVNKLV